MKKEIKKDNLILEDVVYFEEKDGKYVSTAKDTFYYQFLMERADASINGQNNLKAATDFENYEKIYVALLNAGVLNYPAFCIDWTPIYGGACFSFNLSKAMHDLKLEAILANELKGEISSDYIQTMLNPADSFRCAICGAVSLSRHVAFIVDGKKTTYCLACHPISKECQYQIQKVYHKSGTLDAVRERIRLIDEACKPRIAEGKTINILIDEFIEENSVNTNPEVSEIEKLFEKGGYEQFQVFAYDDCGLAIINRERAVDIDVFSEIAALSEDGTEILALFSKAGVCWVDDDARKFVQTIERSIENG